MDNPQHTSKRIPPLSVETTSADFPASQECPSGCVTIPNSGTFFAPFRIVSDIVYQEKSDEKQLLTLFLPQSQSDSHYPTIVYTVGSCWHRQNKYLVFPHAIELVQRGYVFAIAEHRPTEIAPFPAPVEDLKAAIGFLCDHAEKYGVDNKRIAVWGDSSGAHSSVYVSIQNPDIVRCCVDWCGVIDIEAMNYVSTVRDHTGPDSPEGWLIGHLNVQENPGLASKTNPLLFLTAEKNTPPILIMHGDKDPYVPFNQSVLLYNALCNYGKNVQFFKLSDCGHDIITKEAFETTIKFLDSNLR